MRTVMCIVSSTRPEPRVYQPDPPGLIHDDPRLLPPWRGSSLIWGKKFPAFRTQFSCSKALSAPILAVRALRGSSSPRTARPHCAQWRTYPQIGLWDWCLTVPAPHGGEVTAAGRSGVLALLTDPELRDEVDRVAAAVGVRVVHAGGGSAVTRKTWTA